MKHSKKALQLDLEQQYIDALEKYEFAIRNENAEVNIYINLAILYWRFAADFPWCNQYETSENFKSKAVDKYQKVLDEAKTKFPNCCELYFWEKYCLHRLIFDPLDETDVLEIINKYQECSEIPYFFLYLFDKHRYKKERDQLLRECEISPTAKNLYIKSIIEDR